MTESLFSPMWYRVAKLRPRILNHIRIQQRDFRGQIWVTLHDSVSGRHHRVNTQAYDIIGRLSGRATMQEIWEAVVAQRGDAAPDQDEVIRMLGRLHRDGLIQADTDPDIEQLFLHQERLTKQKRAAAVNPFSFRVPLLDPSRLVDRVTPWLKHGFRPLGLTVWLVLVSVAMIAALTNWDALQAGAQRLLETRNLILLLVCYPLVKALHELGHAVAVRTWGGEIREAGVALIMLMPVPYVDASAATAFRSRGQRIAVSAAGIMVELLLASIAMLLWLHVQDGWVRDAAFVIMTIGGVSSLLFNGNPLMRLDGYYMLSDFLEIPNLAARANQRFVQLVERHLLRLKPVDSDDLDRLEATLLPWYAFASFVYRAAISAAVVLWLSSKSLPLALLAGLWMSTVMLLRPLLRGARFLLASPRLGHARVRSIAITGSVVSAFFALLFALPLPSVTRAQGVVWQSDDAVLRLVSAGEVKSLVAHDGQTLRAGELIAVLENPELQAGASVLEAKAARVLVRINQALNEDSTQLPGLQEELTTTTAQLARAQADLDALQIRATVPGRLIIPRTEDLPGTFLKKGATLGYILTGQTLLIRVAVTQEQAGLIRAGAGKISLRLAEDPSRIFSASVVREVPAASGLLHSAALGDRNGGPIRTDPEDKDGLRTVEPVFMFDVAVAGEQPRRLGGRAFLRFDHGSESAAVQLGRALRQLFLRHAQA